MELNEIYQDVILDHNQRPRNFSVMKTPDSYADGYNALCGDKVSVYIRFSRENMDRISEISFMGSGCAISKSSASIMTEFMKNKDIFTIEATFNALHNMILGKGDAVDKQIIKPLLIFEGIKDYPSRVKCVMLVWYALNTAIKNYQKRLNDQGGE